MRGHVERLRGVLALALQLPPPDGAAELAREAVAAAATDEGVLRLFRTARTLLATVAGRCRPGSTALRRAGIAARDAALGERRRGPGLLAGVKATSYATALAAVAEAEARGADDAIFLGEGETVLEATMSNIWWRDGDVLVTPALSTGVLPGVTRGARSRASRGTAGYRIREGSFTLPALLRADEAFTSSAVREMMPVIAVDGRELARGPAAARLQALLEAIAG